MDTTKNHVRVESAHDRSGTYRLYHAGTRKREDGTFSPHVWFTTHDEEGSAFATKWLNVGCCSCWSPYRAAYREARRLLRAYLETLERESVVSLDTFSRFVSNYNAALLRKDHEAEFAQRQTLHKMFDEDPTLLTQFAVLGQFYPRAWDYLTGLYEERLKCC